jgi:hypothetical protein
VGIRHNVPPVSFAVPPRGRGGSSKLPLALLAAADEEAAAEAGRHGNAAGVPQLLVEELHAAPSWELQAYVPGAAAGAGAGAPAAHGSSAGYTRGSSGSHYQQQQQQYNSSGKWGSSGGASSSTGSGYKQERRGTGSSSSGGSMAPQSLPGSLGLVQQQLADVLQPQVGRTAVETVYCIAEYCTAGAVLRCLAGVWSQRDDASGNVTLSCCAARCCTVVSALQTREWLVHILLVSWCAQQSRGWTV